MAKKPNIKESVEEISIKEENFLLDSFLKRN